MSREVDARIRRFDEVLDRLPGGIGRGVTTRRIQRTVTNAGRRFRRGVIAVAVELLALLAYSLFIGPIGVVGFLLAMLLIPLLFVIAASLPLRNTDVVPEILKKTAAGAAAEARRIVARPTPGRPAAVGRADARPDLGTSQPDRAATCCGAGDEPGRSGHQPAAQHPPA